MRSTPLLIAALVPFVATAGAATSSNTNTVDYQELRDDLQVTTLLGAEVQASDGEQVGAVEDVVLDRNGRIVSVIIQREGDAGAVVDEAGQDAEDALEGVERTAERTWDDATSERDRPTRDTVADTEEPVETTGAEGAEDQDGMGLDPDRAGTMEVGDEFSKVSWDELNVDRQAGVIRLTGGTASLQAVQYDQTEPLQMEGEVRASNLVGMEVNLTDEESFGEVEDVLIDTESGQASAIVVDSMEFFDKERYALPVDLSNMNLEEEELTLQFTQQQIDTMEEFQMEETGTMDESRQEEPGTQQPEATGDTDDM